MVVLHDLAPGATPRLQEFLDRVEAVGASFTQAFPDDCVLIDDGVPTPALRAPGFTVPAHG